MLNKRQRLLVELDSLIDTRLGTVKRFWGDKINDDTLDEYHRRDHIRIWDIFGIEKDAYEKAYAERDILTLKESFGTLMSEMLRSIITTSIMKAESNPHISQVEVTLNSAPYDLDEDTKAVFLEVLRDLLLIGKVRMIKEITTKVSKVDIANMSAADIRKEYEGVIMYDLAGWLSTANQLTADNPAPTLTIYYASLLSDDSEENRRKVTEENTNPFKETKRACAQFFTAEGLDAELFNIIKT